jgi:hypothetical protein
MDGRLEALRLLLEAGADARALMEDGRSVLYFAMRLVERSGPGGSGRARECLQLVEAFSERQALAESAGSGKGEAGAKRL